MTRRVVHIAFSPDDPGETWKRTVAGAKKRLAECEEGMERERGEGVNTGWLYWNSEWGEVFHWLRKRAPRVWAKMVAQAEADAKGEP